MDRICEIDKERSPQSVVGISAFMLELSQDTCECGVDVSPPRLIGARVRCCSYSSETKPCYPFQQLTGLLLTRRRGEPAVHRVQGEPRHGARPGQPLLHHLPDPDPGLTATVHHHHSGKRTVKGGPALSATSQQLQLNCRGYIVLHMFGFHISAQTA